VALQIAGTPRGWWDWWVSQPSFLVLWDARTGTKLKRWPVPAGATRAAFSPDGGWLACTTPHSDGRQGLVELHDLTKI
jgi:hypothetical protein